MKEIFKSERYFVLFDVVVSHGQLLLRSQKTDDASSTIDIIFFDVDYVQIPSNFRRIRIKQIENNQNIIRYKTVEKYLNFANNYLFEIESNDETYYIAASFVRIFENQLEFYESSLNQRIKGVEIATSLL